MKTARWAVLAKEPACRKSACFEAKFSIWRREGKPASGDQSHQIFFGNRLKFCNKFFTWRREGKPEMVRTADKTVAPFWPVSQAPVLAEVGISGALFFGSFLLDEQKK